MSTTDSEFSRDDSNTNIMSNTPIPNYININDPDEAIKLNEDIFHVFILHLLTITKPNRNTKILGITALIIFCIQLICLFGISYIYFHDLATKEAHYVNQLTALADNQLYYRRNRTNVQVHGDIFIDINVPNVTILNLGQIQYWSVIIALFIISCYLFQTIQTFISTLSIFVFCDTYIKNSHYNLLSKCIISMNLGLIFNIWIFSSSIMWFGFDTITTSDLLMIPIAIIFIMQIDDWSYKWFFPKFIDDSINSEYIIVKYIQYSDTTIKYSLCSIVMCLSWIVCMDLCYDMFWEQNIEIFVLISYTITFLTSILCPIIMNYPQTFGDAFFALPFISPIFILTAVFSWIVLNEMHEADYRGHAWIMVIVGSSVALIGLGLCILTVILKGKIDFWQQSMYVVVPLISMISAMTLTWSIDTKLQFQYDDEIYGWFLIFIALTLSPITMALYIVNYVKNKPYIKLIGICVLLLLLFVAYNICMQYILN